MPSGAFFREAKEKISVIHLLHFHHAMSWDAGRGERLLRPFFKGAAVTCQQRSADALVTQLAARAQEKLVLAKALLSRSKRASREAILEARSSLPGRAGKASDLQASCQVGHVLRSTTAEAKRELQWGGTSAMAQARPVCSWWVAQSWSDEAAPRDAGQPSVATPSASAKVLVTSVFIERAPTAKEMESGTTGLWSSSAMVTFHPERSRFAGRATRRRARRLAQSPAVALTPSLTAVSAERALLPRGQRIFARRASATGGSSSQRLSLLKRRQPRAGALGGGRKFQRCGQLQLKHWTNVLTQSRRPQAPKRSGQVTSSRGQRVTSEQLGRRRSCQRMTRLTRRQQ